MTDAMRAGFIAWSYAGCGLMVTGLVAWIALDAMRVRRRLADLDKAGIRRRSAGSAQ